MNAQVRPPLDAGELNRSLVAPWREVRVLESVDSTNNYVLSVAKRGEPEGLVVVAEHQTDGRGRKDRTWESPPRAGLTFSLLLRPQFSATTRLWVPLILATALADALADRCDVAVKLKWPNDVLIGGRKVAGMLSEVAGDALVAGIGLNVTTRRNELPVPEATSLALETATSVDRGAVLLTVLAAMGIAYTGWSGDVGQAAERYRQRCDTIGRRVVVDLGEGHVLRGEAVAVDDIGCLVVRTAAGDVAVSAGDVKHVRPEP